MIKIVPIETPLGCISNYGLSARSKKTDLPPPQNMVLFPFRRESSLSRFVCSSYQMSQTRKSHTKNFMSSLRKINTESTSPCLMLEAKGYGIWAAQSTPRERNRFFLHDSGLHTIEYVIFVSSISSERKSTSNNKYLSEWVDKKLSIVDMFVCLVPSSSRRA